MENDEMYMEYLAKTENTFENFKKNHEYPIYSTFVMRRKPEVVNGLPIMFLSYDCYILYFARNKHGLIRNKTIRRWPIFKNGKWCLPEDITDGA